ncbi:cation channel sperm-associated protein subunit beta-like [Actinia tenebrosa]|uniref:Cation channel sperm-associated protein subunit beta-like n=1 Tax=Actinia tenebrosa TaxID=6105 RepID=A0A6P8HF05_ACTTE|nr:cation channel sperm-associated protein subunit beta-like [Actinia tenebrosa]
MPRTLSFLSVFLCVRALFVCLAVLSTFQCSFSSFLPYDFGHEDVESVVYTSNSEDNGTDSFGQLYFQGSSMVIIYQVRYRYNDTKYNRNSLVRRYASQGIKPNIRFWNLTWNTSFELKELVEEDTVYWRRNISKLQISQDTNYISGSWKYLVELGKGLNLFEKSGSLILKDEEPLLNLEFGDEITNPILFQSKPNGLIIKSSPCSSGVAAIVPVINTTEDEYSGCYFGVTYNYFNPSSVSWHNLLHQSSAIPNEYSICKQSSFSKCANLSIIDFTLLKNHLLFLTTNGILLSKNFTKALRNGPGTKLSFTSVQSIHPDIDEAIRMGSVNRREDMKLFHTPHCHRSYVSDLEEVCIVYRNNTSNSSLTVCSYAPFERWRTLVLESAPEKHYLLDMVQDIDRQSTVALINDKSQEVTLLQVYNGTKLSFPAFIFDKGETAESLYFHAYTKIIYAYGSQVWQSLDGGNSFYKVTSLHDQDRVTSFSIDLFGNTFCVTTRLGSILIGKAGIHRAIVVERLGNGSLSHPVYTQVLGHANTVVALKPQVAGGNFSLSPTAFEIKRDNESQHTLPLSLLASFRDETQVEFYVSSECGDCFSSGQVIYSKYGGSARIVRVEKTSILMSNVFKHKIVGLVTKAFAEPPRNRTNSLLQVRWSGWNASLTLLSRMNTDDRWQEDDLGKTVILPEGQSFILKHYVNETTFIGLTYIPWMRNTPWEDTFEGWTLHDFRDPISSNISWWVNEDTCRSVLLERRNLDMRLFHLDSMDSLTFTATSISKTTSRQPFARVFISNPRLFILKSVVHTSFLNTSLTALISQKPSARGTSSLTVLLQHSSLFCKSTSFTISIHSGCPPSKKLRYIYPSTFSDASFLDAKAIDSKGIQRNFKLPFNYRPPSARGKAIPLTGNIYNVDPKRPHYKDAYSVTRETVQYKQCQGVNERTACGCTLGMRRSSSERYSDCIDTVYRILFTEKLMPKFTVSRDERETIKLDSPYYLKELNNRIDYEALNPSTKTFPGIPYIIMEEKMNSSVEFVGSGLYHFRAHVVQDNYTFCELTDEFLVFVVDTPLPYPVKDIVMACTVMGFSSMLYLIYLVFFHGKKKIKYD